jgi:hypothetical protein
LRIRTFDWTIIIKIISYNLTIKERYSFGAGKDTSDRANSFLISIRLVNKKNLDEESSKRRGNEKREIGRLCFTNSAS